jgi:hypothetical protein
MQAAHIEDKLGSDHSNELIIFGSLYTVALHRWNMQAGSGSREWHGEGAGWEVECVGMTGGVG